MRLIDCKELVVNEVLGVILYFLILVVALVIVVGVPAVTTFQLARIAYWKRGGLAGLAVAIMMSAAWWNEPGVTCLVSLPLLGFAWWHRRRHAFDAPLPELPRAEVV